MGKRGPKKTPKPILELRGSLRARGRTDNAIFNEKEIVCPAWLNGEARNTWDRMIPQLELLGLISEIDVFAFARYCLYGVLWLKELGNPGRTEATLERYANQLNRLESSFGLTPAARASVKVEKPKEKGVFEKMLG